MSSTVYIVFDKKVAGYEPDDRCNLAYVFFEEQFKELARKIAVPPLTDFYSDDPDSLDSEIDDPIVREDLKKQLGPAKYFSPVDGLRSVRAILARLRKEPLQLSRPGRNLAEDLLNDLAEVNQALEKASEQGARFYFKVGE
jgi:hypothetical protein